MADGMQQEPTGQEQGQSTLPTDILVGMQAVGEALQSAGAPEQILQQLAQAMQLYQGVLEAMSGGGGQQQTQPQMVEGQQGQLVQPQG